MVKLTADLIAESTQHVNPCRERIFSQNLLVTIVRSDPSHFLDFIEVIFFKYQTQINLMVILLYWEAVLWNFSRELDLRGYKFNQIENLGATLDQFDRKCFDIFSKYRVATQCIVQNGCISIVKYDDEW